MSTRLDPERSGTVEIRSHPEMPSSPGSVGLARAYPLIKIQAMEPSRQTWSSYGPPYPLGRWSSEVLLDKALSPVLVCRDRWNLCFDDT